MSTSRMFTPSNRNAAVIALTLFVSTITNAQTPTTPPMEVSKQQFIDMSLNMAEKASAMQADIKQRQETSLREQMGDEKFKLYQAETQSAEKAAEEKLASCLGITHKKLKSFEQTMGTEFQVDAIEQCKSKLPEKINVNAVVDPTQSPELASYVGCMEKLAISKTGVPAEKIKNCAVAQAE